MITRQIDSHSGMIDISMRPVWNPNISLTVENGDRAQVHLPLQQNNFIKFRCIKVLSCYTAKCDASKLNTWGIFKYFDGSKDIKEICETIIKYHPEVTEKNVIEKIEKLFLNGLLIDSKGK